MKIRQNTAVGLSSLLVICLICSISCRQNANDTPDVSGIEVNPQIFRFEVDLFSIDTIQPANSIMDLEARYPEFLPIYLQIMTPQGPAGPEEISSAELLPDIVKDPRMRHLYDTSMLVFADFSKIEKDFTQALKYYKYYFPGQKEPTLTTFISEYSIATFIYGQDQLAAGLDFFLGDQYPYQSLNPGNPNFSGYLTRTFNADHLVIKTFFALVEDLAGPSPDSRLLDLMVHQGKKLFILEKLFPNAADTLIFEHSAPQMEWMNENETGIWAYFVSEDLLYSSRQKDIRKYVEKSPDSPGMPPEAPGNTGSWLGYNIVKTYMNRFPDKNLIQLLRDRDAQRILTESRYKPGK